MQKDILNAVVAQIEQLYPYLSVNVHKDYSLLIHPADNKYINLHILLLQSQNHTFSISFNGGAKLFDLVGIEVCDKILDIVKNHSKLISYHQCHALQKTIDEQKEMIEKLRKDLATITAMVMYAPDNPGYQEAKADFQSWL